MPPGPEEGAVVSGTEPASVPEIERKYVLRPGQSLPGVDGLPATARAPSVDPSPAQYFDTARPASAAPRG